MRIFKTKTLKLKAILLSTDGGRSWIVGRQYYLTDLSQRQEDGSTPLLNDSMQGILLSQEPENTNHEQQTDRSERVS